MNDDLLSGLAGPKTDEERAWLVTEDLLNSLPSDLRSLACAAAVPHWFDAQILATLRPELEKHIAQLYTELQNLPFTEVFLERGHNIHEQTRRLILDHSWKEDPVQFRVLSERAARYFSQGDGSEIEIEAIYHLVIANPFEGANALWSLDTTWNNTFRYSELESLVNTLLEHAESNRITGRARAMVYYRKGRGALLAYKAREALSALTKARQEVEQDKTLLAYILEALGDTSQFLKRNSEALKHYNKALDLYREVDDQIGMANALKSIGDVLLFLKRNDEALTRFNEALDLYQEVDDQLGEANALKSTGDVLLFLKRNTKALARYNEALDLYREVGDDLGEAHATRSIADLTRFLGEHENALEQYEKALELYRDVDDQVDEAITLKAIGDVTQFLGRKEEASAFYEEALKLFRAVGDPLGEAVTFQSYGDDRVSHGDFVQALRFYQAALARYSQTADNYDASRLPLQTAFDPRILERKTKVPDNVWVKRVLLTFGIQAGVLLLGLLVYIRLHGIDLVSLLADGRTGIPEFTYIGNNPTLGAMLEVVFWAAFAATLRWINVGTVAARRNTFNPVRHLTDWSSDLIGTPMVAAILVYTLKSFRLTFGTNGAISLSEAGISTFIILGFLIGYFNYAATVLFAHSWRRTLSVHGSPKVASKRKGSTGPRQPKDASHYRLQRGAGDRESES